MNRSSNGPGALLRAIAALGVVGAACLTRPVVTADPNLKTNFTNIIHSVAVDKLDLLFMIDNSASMGDKQALLAQAVPDMINRLVSPNCVDTAGATLMRSSGGQCTMGKLEFPAVHDMHLGIITSSLGGRGASTTCDPTVANPASPNLSAHNDDRGELINRGGADEHNVPKANPSNFLAWYPPIPANTSPPASPETTVGDPMTPGTLIGDFSDMISGVHEHGCGFEAQNEAWYRFLIQPDPFQSIAVGANNKATLTGTDTVILQQRKAFLRPDSLLAIIVVTDENEEVANPVSIGGEGWLYELAPWPNSPSGGGGPEGTVECRTNAIDPNCTSCAFSTVVGSSNFASRCPNDLPAGVQGYLDPSNDNVNVRFFNQKQRFGVFAGYPLARYIIGLTSSAVPDRGHEVDGSGNYVGDQAMYRNCVNPIFAQDLPTDPTKVCSLTRGPRTPDLIYYAVIGGVPHQLLQAQPGDPECPMGTNPVDCPQKDVLPETNTAPASQPPVANWLAITGKDPENYDFSGADFHMIESEDPRGGSGCPPGSNDTCDPINGREWDTKKGDLQYACTFQLAAPKDCTSMAFQGACDCTAGATSQNTPLCQKTGGTYGTTQIAGKAYPSIREMAIAHAMSKQPSGNQAIVSSMCPIHTTATSNTDPVFGYRPAVNAIINRLKNALSVQCLPQKLTADANGNVPCLILVTLPMMGGQDQCKRPNQGLSPPPPDVFSRFRDAQHAAWVQSGGATSALIDPYLLPICQLQELVPMTTTNAGDFPAGQDCSASTKPGWCYIEGQAAGSCPQQVIFTAGQPPPGASVNLQCIEQAHGVTDGG
jgi:hypothetical protein